MQYLDDFMHGKAGLDIVNSKVKHIIGLSILISKCYPDYVTDRRHCTLYEYYETVAGDTSVQKKWEVLVFEPELRSFNAYRLQTAEEFRIKYPVVTAAEMLNDECVVLNEISETDLERVLEDV